MKLNTELKQCNLPDDIRKYLMESEAGIPNLTQGTEKKVCWYNNKVNSKTKYSIVYIHGFTATRQEILPVPDNVANTIKANIYYCRLKGHGGDSDIIGEAGFNDWLNDVYEAYEIGKKIGEEVIFMATSTGAPLALWLSLHYKMKSLVLISPNLKPADPLAGLILSPIGKLAVNLVVGKYKKWDYVNELHTKYWTTQFSSKSLFSMMKCCKLAAQIDYKQIKTPLLLLYTENDVVVSIKEILKKFEETGSPIKKIINTKSKDHVIAGDIIEPEKNEYVTTLITEFLKEIL